MACWRRAEISMAEDVRDMAAVTVTGEWLVANRLVRSLVFPESRSQLVRILLTV